MGTGTGAAPRLNTQFEILSLTHVFPGITMMTVDSSRPDLARFHPTKNRGEWAPASLLGDIDRKNLKLFHCEVRFSDQHLLTVTPGVIHITVREIRVTLRITVAPVDHMDVMPATKRRTIVTPAVNRICLFCEGKFSRWNVPRILQGKEKTFSAGVLSIGTRTRGIPREGSETPHDRILRSQNHGHGIRPTIALRMEI